MATGSGGYDWNRPARPPGFGFWIADHRLVVRSLCLAVDATLVAIVVASLVRGEVWWQLYFQAVLWPWLTYQAGWSVPATVDRWRSDQNVSGAGVEPDGSDGS